MQKYIEQIKALANPDFQSIRKIAEKSISCLPAKERSRIFNEMNRGVAILNSHEQLCMYLYSYGNMHQAKLLDAFSNLPPSLFAQPFEVIDWGCGQALGTIVLYDVLREKQLDGNIKKATLIEPSKTALERGVLHASQYLTENTELKTINNLFEYISPQDIKSNVKIPVIHIFSNILDVAQIDLKHLANIIDTSAISDHYLVCVGPLNPNNPRMDAFFRYFNDNSTENLYSFQSYEFQAGFMTNINTYKAKIYKFAYTDKGHLIPIEYYPPVQFQSAYELDIVRLSRKNETEVQYSEKLSCFEVAAPFDLGASVYEDVHPVLAVLNNIVTRGLPTKASVFIEEQFEKAFGITKKNTNNDEINFLGVEPFGFKTLQNSFLGILDSSEGLCNFDIVKAQILLTPIAIARFQKVLIEAIITEQLSIKQDVWKIMVEESDVPFASLALKDFEQLFNHVTQLSENYNDVKLPEIELHVLSNTTFAKSALHVFGNVYTETSQDLLNIEYDMVVTQAVFKSVSQSIESFSKFKCRNNCYFNLRSIVRARSERVVYTSSLIKYKPLVEKDTQGNYTENESNRELLKYFLQLLFRKVDFRAGQLPILDRALRNLPVIGLLPTGGGKSLTYQIAAFLQPGVTVVVDPLKSLMKDQFDGLISQGIDNIAYINSSQSKKEREEIEFRLESSQLLIIFLSPERLSIQTFRERLKNMHDHNVYFSYGVIDEVHCVSEWGHDFRFSYLHLGRNLYNYVKAKEGEISLFGLTATASFDVLADVERELSGNGAFALDAEAIVRYENVNRLELQYKIEKVPVEFEADGFYDQNNDMPSHLPKALNITNHWPVFDSKGEFLAEYIKEIPQLLNELQEPSNINFIKESFLERQNLKEKLEQDLEVEMPIDFYSEKEIYQQAGIVFCPHKSSTGVSVTRNHERIQSFIADVGSFSGGDTSDVSIPNLEKFRENKIPLMIATKAFGMGIDKPNVRFTVNINYSSSLEAFVQEAGRAGRDRKMALASILISDYKLVKINPRYNAPNFPNLWIIRNKWFLEDDLWEILNYYGKTIPENEIMVATPSKDIVKLYCYKNNRIFGFNQCADACTESKKCTLSKVPSDLKGWKHENELLNDLRVEGLKISKKNFQYLNADYDALMYFFSESFKGDIIEKTYMHKLLVKLDVHVETVKYPQKLETRTGFMNTLGEKNPNEKVVVYVPYVDDKDLDNDDDMLDTSINRASDISKAIYRMCCIELIEDFTQDYRNSRFRIVVVKKEPGGYFKGLESFLLRYYTPDRAVIEIEKAKNTQLKNDDFSDIEKEIFKCLSFLTEFVYDKISEKRKRAIDDMRNFCMEGLDDNYTWLEANEKLKDFIYYYFNSKYAKKDYVAENGEPFSLVEDTEAGRKSSNSILFKYLRVIDNDIVGIGMPLDNVKHLYGAVRLISRSLTDSNPALYLLETFCLAYMGTRGNENLKSQLIQRYYEGIIETSNRGISQSKFWDIFETYNSKLSPYLDSEFFAELQEEAIFLTHASFFKKISQKYIE